jgi:hypothetical protein
LALDTEAWLALALDVIWVVLHARPAFVRATLWIEVDHHVLAFGVIICMPVAVHFTRPVGGDAIEWSVAAYAVDDFLVRCGFESLGVGVGECTEWPGGGVVPRKECRIVGPAVVVGCAGDGIEAVDSIGLNVVLARSVASTIGAGLFFCQEVQWAVGEISMMSGREGGSATRTVCRW